MLFIMSLNVKAQDGNIFTCLNLRTSSLLKKGRFDDNKLNGLKTRLLLFISCLLKTQSQLFDPPNKWPS